MGKAKKKSSKSKGRGAKAKAKGSSVFTEAAQEYLSKRGATSEVILSKSSHRMPTLSNQSLDLSNRKQVQDFLEWTIAKPVLVLAREVFLVLPFAQQLPIEESHKFLLLTVSSADTSPTFCLVSAERVDVEHLEKCMGASEAEGSQGEDQKTTDQLSSTSRYDYWATFAATPPLNEQAKELMNSKNVKWKLLEHFAGEFPTVDVDGSVKQFLDKQQCEIAIIKRSGPYDKVFLTFDLQQMVGIAAWQSAKAQEVERQLAHQIIERTPPQRFTKFAILLGGAKPVLLASLQLDFQDLFQAFAMMSGGPKAQVSCQYCGKPHGINAGSNCPECTERVCDDCNFQQKIKCYNQGKSMSCLMCKAKIKAQIAIGKRVIELKDMPSPPATKVETTVTPNPSQSQPSSAPTGETE